MQSRTLCSRDKPELTYVTHKLHADACPFHAGSLCARSRIDSQLTWCMQVKNRAVSMADFVAAVATYMDNLSVYAARRRSSSGPASSTVSSLAQA